MRYVAGVLVAVLAVAAAPALAAADPIPYPATRYARELAFSGPRLLWTDPDGGLRAQDPGGAPRVLFVPRGRGAPFPSVAQVVADPARIAFIAQTEFDEDGEMWQSLRAGPPDGPFALIAGTERASLEPPLYGPIAVYDGGLLEMSVVDGASQVTVRPDGGPPRALFRGTTASDVVATGGVAAVVSQSDFARQTPPSQCCRAMRCRGRRPRRRRCTRSRARSTSLAASATAPSCSPCAWPVAST
jgi:hypothetical protein